MSHKVERMIIAEKTEAPWHRTNYGEIKNGATPDEWIVASGCDWEAERRPLFYTKDGVNYPTAKEALVRSDNNFILDYVTDTWVPVQNRDAFRTIGKFAKEGKIKLETAGSLDEGRFVWVLGRLTHVEKFDGIKDSKGKIDQVNPYVLFVNPHKYGHVSSALFTPTRVVCWNTLSLALSEATQNSIVFKHAHRTEFNVEAAQALLANTKELYDAHSANAVTMASARYTEATLRKYFDYCFPSKEDARKESTNKAQQLLALVDKQPGTQFAPGTWWQAYNAVTYGLDHVFGRDEELRLQKAWFGKEALTKIKALNKAVELAEQSF